MARRRPVDMRNAADSSRGGTSRRTCRSQTDFPQRHKPANTLRYVSARQGRSGDVFDIRLEAQLVELLPPGKLVPPGIAAHLTAVAFPVSEHLERSEATRGIDSRGVGDEVLPSHH